MYPTRPLHGMRSEETEVESIENAVVAFETFGEAQTVLRLFEFKDQIRDEFELKSNALIKIEASTVSMTDVLIRKNLYHKNVKFPHKVGLDLVGRIEGLGIECTGFNVGDRVCALGFNIGGNSRYALLPSRRLLPCPDDISPTTLAVMIRNYVAAYQCLYRVGGIKIRAGHKVLVTGGAGAIGQAMIQLALAAGASEVYGTGRGAASRRIIKNSGARPLGREPSEWLSQVEGRMDIVIDSTCSDGFSSSHKALNSRGKLVCVGTTAVLSIGNSWFGGQPIKTKFDIMRAAGFMSQTSFYDVFASYDSRKDVFKSDLVKIYHLCRQGLIAPKVAYCVTLNELANAHEDVEAGGLDGTIVCQPFGPMGQKKDDFTEGEYSMAEYDDGSVFGKRHGSVIQSSFLDDGSIMQREDNDEDEYDEADDAFTHTEFDESHMDENGNENRPSPISEGRNDADGSEHYSIPTRIETEDYASPSSRQPPTSSRKDKDHFSIGDDDTEVRSIRSNYHALERKKSAPPGKEVDDFSFYTIEPPKSEEPTIVEEETKLGDDVSYDTRGAETRSYGDQMSYDDSRVYDDTDNDGYNQYDEPTKQNGRRTPYDENKYAVAKVGPRKGNKKKKGNFLVSFFENRRKKNATSQIIRELEEIGNRKNSKRHLLPKYNNNKPIKSLPTKPTYDKPPNNGRYPEEEWDQRQDDEYDRGYGDNISGRDRPSPRRERAQSAGPSRRNNSRSRSNSRPRYRNSSVDPSRRYDNAERVVNPTKLMANSEDEDSRTGGPPLRDVRRSSNKRPPRYDDQRNHADRPPRDQSTQRRTSSAPTGENGRRQRSRSRSASRTRSGTTHDGSRYSSRQNERPRSIRSDRTPETY